MGGLFGILSITREALVAQQAGLNTTGQNVANVNTPGYARRAARFETRFGGEGSDGGVAFVGVARMVDRRASERVVTEHGRQGAAEARADALLGLEGIVAPERGSVRERVDDLFDALQAWSDLPSDPSARAGVLGRLEDLASTVSTTADDLVRMRTELGSRAAGVAREVNSRLERIAALNNDVALAQARGDAAADLRDSRDVLVREVGDLIGARTLEGDDGKITLVAAGTALLEGDRFARLEVDSAPDGMLRVRAYQPSGSVNDVTSQVTEGTLGGIREVRDADTTAVQSALDRFAYEFAGAMNTAHAAGFALDGSTGRPLFTPPGTVAGAAYGLRVDPSVAGHPERLGAASGARDLPGGNGAALALRRLGTSSLAGAGLPSERMASLEGEVGALRAGAESERALRADTVLQAESLHESVSGVSLDEEMVNLTKFQRAFEASAKVLRTIDELLDMMIKAV